MNDATFVCPGFCGRLEPATNITMDGLQRLDQPGTSSLNVSSWKSGTDITLEFIFTHCKPCPWGMRKNHRSFCQPCNTPLSTYDCMFLIFHAVAPFFLNTIAINYHTVQINLNQRRIFWLFLQTLCAFIESLMAFFTSLSVFEPFGNFQTYGCNKEGSLHEWYSMWHNPILDYSRVLYCSYELVYPLFSLPFVIYAFNLVYLLVFRSLLYALASLSNGRRNLLSTNPFYVALWALLLLALVHSILAGLFYLLFPYVTLFASLIMLVIHLSIQSSPQHESSGRSGPTVCGMFRRVFTCFTCNNPGCIRFTSSGPILLLALLIHFAMFAFALISLAVASVPSGQFNELTNTAKWLLLFGMPTLLPAPLLFFILTVRLTAPNATIGTVNRTHR